MKTKEVKPYGMLYSQGREYFLLHPLPVSRDSWQNDNTYAFLVTPRKEIKMGGGFKTYPVARHIVTNAFVLEYSDEMPEITIIKETE